MKHNTAAFVLVLCGCTSMNIARMSNDQLQTVNIDDLCQAYYEYRHNEDVKAKLHKEIKNRNFTERELDMMLEHKIFSGMSRAALLCSWGRPSHVNVSTTQGRRSEQWVYSNHKEGIDYVYVESGEVTRNN